MFWKVLACLNKWIKIVVRVDTQNKYGKRTVLFLSSKIGQAMPGGSAVGRVAVEIQEGYIPGMKNIGNVICQNGPPAVRVYRVKTFVHYTRYRAETPGRSVELPRVFLSRFGNWFMGITIVRVFEIAFYQSRKAAITIKYRGICHPLFTPFTNSFISVRQWRKVVLPCGLWSFYRTPCNKTRFRR